jgi:hypothetical protein
MFVRLLAADIELQSSKIGFLSGHGHEALLHALSDGTA